MKELTKEMAKEWQNVTLEERAACDAIAVANKAAYEDAMRVYHETQLAQAPPAGGAGAIGDAGGAVRCASVVQRVCRAAPPSTDELPHARAQGM
jgi:hypothetical protein